MAVPLVWVVVGASRGIGLEWVRQLLARGDHVLATVRDVAKASQLWTLAGCAAVGRCQLFECDVASEASINVTTLRTSFMSLIVESDETPELRSRDSCVEKH